MNNLTAKIESMFNAVRNATGDVTFKSGDDDFVLTSDGYLYATVNGELLPGGKKVSTMGAVARFIALRAA